MTARELEIKNRLYNQYKQNKEKFVDDYESEAEHVMLGRAINLAKQMAENENKLRIKEMIKKALTEKPLIEEPLDEINSVEYIQTLKPIENDSEDIIKLSVPLLIRIMEYSREDAKTDMDLHFAAENMIQLSKANRNLHMSDYESIVLPYGKIDQND
jgi:hypothetical protein